MNFSKAFLLLIMFFVSKELFSSDHSSWKENFFSEYMQKYAAHQPSTHAGFAHILLTSWKTALKQVPAQDVLLAHRINAQVIYFVHLNEQATRDRETEKCIQGMAQANSVWARLVTTSYKANCFVAEFDKEYNKRTAL